MHAVFEGLRRRELDHRCEAQECDLRRIQIHVKSNVICILR